MGGKNREWRNLIHDVSLIASLIPLSHRLQVNALSTGMLAHLILGDMAKTADASKVRIKPHMVFVTSSGHYDVDFVQKDAEKILETINDPFSYPSKDARPYELYKIAKRESFLELC